MLVPMSLETFVSILRQLLPEVTEGSSLLWPLGMAPITLPASVVFDTLRAHVDPPVTEEQFNFIADALDAEKEILKKRKRRTRKNNTNEN